MKKVAVALLALVGLGAWGWTGWSGREKGPPRYQGWVEADTIFIGAEDTGRLATLAVSEGQQVKAGDLLFVLDSRTQAADLQAAKQALDEASSKVERLQAAQQRPEEIAILEATLQRAQASLEFARQELTRTQELVRKGFATQSRADQAQSTFDQAKAAAEEVQRQIVAARLGGRREDLDAARFVVGQAEARVASARARFDRLTVAAPQAGRVQEVYYRAGEIVPNMRPVVAILPPANMKVRFFLPQAVLPSVQVGQAVALTCDGCPAGLAAEIITIAQEAEFTPPVIYSLEERQKLVYRVEARPRTPEALRVGQPVEVRLGGGGDALR
ncbi:HlyD family efflux transporter periplasmic adaptor subunit [uncultured Alsobacter sp.]|uniref:HlyD family secretion protein n=1 Tax=uncultured Alsobacter sp. TaxID=1748258 RepID=UPI0025F1454F|nr:HlyD family efflux transporter periplasmic adaptor subunit [uncultured Alsobacter sp.]